MCRTSWRQMMLLLALMDQQNRCQEAKYFTTPAAPFCHVLSLRILPRPEMRGLSRPPMLAT